MSSWSTCKRTNKNNLLYINLQKALSTQNKDGLAAHQYPHLQIFKPRDNVQGSRRATWLSAIPLEVPQLWQHDVTIWILICLAICYYLKHPVCLPSCCDSCGADFTLHHGMDRGLVIKISDCMLASKVWPQVGDKRTMVREILHQLMLF